MVGSITNLFTIRIILIILIPLPMIKFPAYRGGGWRESLRDRQIKNLFKKKSPSDFDHIKVGRRICRVGGGVITIIPID